MKKILSICLLLGLGACTFAQGRLPSRFNLPANSDTAFNLPGKYFQVLRDTGMALTFNQVRTNTWLAKFEGGEKKYPPGHPMSSHVLWTRYLLHNRANKAKEIALSTEYSTVDFYFRKAGEKWLHKTTGYRVPYSKRNDLKLINTVTYTLEPGEHVLIYERQYNNWQTISPGVRIGFARTTIQQEYISERKQTMKLVLALIAGVVLFAAVINFFFFFMIRERVYLYYGLTLLFGDWCYFHLWIQDLIPEDPARSSDAGNTILLFAIFFSLFTVRHFLRTNLHYPRWDKFLHWLSWIMLIFVPLAVIAPNDRFNIIRSIPQVIIFTVLGALAVTPLLFLGKRFSEARLFLLAFAPFVAFLVSLLITLGLKYRGLQPYLASVMLFSVLWAILVLSWSLFLRFKRLLNENARQALEKERMAREKETERNELIARQKVELEKEVQERTAELKQSLHELKATQAQLIQSEKMASLGDLTAGIAHEIQNPLNFVNNFSEVSMEMLEEMEEEMGNGEWEIAGEIAKDVKLNLEKINHHGKRADAIVKGMLQHSRSSSGQKEPTDLNALADEYLRLCFHGLRAKDKSFNSKLVTDYDHALPPVSVAKQDLGRVLLNLFANAFYSVAAKKKRLGDGYEPTVTVQTRLIDQEIEISVTDNGSGIPQKVLDKIYQPFFTTKPTGEGTGLGLSLSYDIVTKGHGGTLLAETEEGEFARFRIRVPRD
ncbi:sensor histidine kinase [Hufsiella ginkgonis]|uniref:histidine kinase n=1 Tax=Hufsiella ginkgonis TaxID=2695274 RepID=A0A7K1XWV9_9SPHI|nr:ATP-binding protein [Hufsiella ginkgonis]MXV15475.1 hypothetical protein [Hufsiella ginkgonis]